MNVVKGVVMGCALAILVAAHSLGNAATGRVVEFYNSTIDHYFITADPAEANAIDTGSAGPGWARTKYSFPSGGTTQVCRFYGSITPGPNSHFYTANSSECNELRVVTQKAAAGDKVWNFESYDFQTTPPLGGACAAGLVSIYRAYNNGFARGVDSNHRFSVDKAAIDEVVARGWISEGLVMCAPSLCEAPTTWNGERCLAPEGVKVSGPRPVPAGCTDSGMQCWKDAVADGVVKFIATSARTTGVPGYEDRPVMFGYFINGGGDSSYSGPNSATLFWADTGEPMWPVSVSSGYGLKINWAQGDLNGLFLQLSDGTCGRTHWVPPTAQYDGAWTNTLVPCP